MTDFRLVSTIVLLGFLNCTAAGAPVIEKRSEEQSVSIISLIANPERFDGEYVSVGGFLRVSVEYENLLFIDEVAANAAMTSNAIAISFEESDDEILRTSRRLHGSYVFIAGSFTARNTIFTNGELTHIYSIIPVSE